VIFRYEAATTRRRSLSERDKTIKTEEDIDTVCRSTD